MSKRLNKQDLARLLKAAGTTSTKKEALAIIESLTSIIQSEVAKGNTLCIPDFGKFYSYTIKSGIVMPKFIAYNSYVHSLN